MPSSNSSIAIVSSAWELDFRQAVRRARAEGFAAIQLEANDAGLDITRLSDSGRREVRQILTSADLRLVGLRADLGGKGFGPTADVDAVLARLDAILESAAGLQSPLVCIDAGPLPEPLPIEKPRPAIDPDLAGLLIIPKPSEPARVHTAPAAPFDAALAASVDGAMMELGRRADRYGVTVAFRSELASFAAVERALQAAGCPWFGIDLDPVAILRDAWPIDEIFSRLGGSILHVRARDALLGANRRTKPAVIGGGSTSWGDLLAKLGDAGYSRWLTIDPTDLPQRATAATSGAEYLRQIQT